MKNSPPRWRTWARRGILLLVVLTIVWLSASWVVAYQLTRRRYAPFPEPAPTVSWATIAEQRIQTSDGETIGAWFIDSGTPKPVVVLVHGFRCCRSSCFHRGKMLATAGYSVLLISQRAHGDSTGAVNDIGYSARHDVIAAVAWVERRCPQRKIIVFGTSQGAAAAMFAATHLGRRVDGYIWECPYQDLDTAVRHRTEYYLPPVIAQIAYAGLYITAPLVLTDAATQSPCNAVADMPDVPVLILAGAKDRKARPREARTIYAHVRDHATLEMFANGVHSRLEESDPQKYRRVVMTFLQAVDK